MRCRISPTTKLLGLLSRDTTGASSLINIASTSITGIAIIAAVQLENLITLDKGPFLACIHIQSFVLLASAELLAMVTTSLHAPPGLGICAV
ncbi:hypothetical protein QBC35DRAFT_487992 [Podospora australis]|uniref:Uncharacterized protein n=1 Tax=Podospora australis TaxID=1536484 RepID=A0AAN7AJU4_9PEZI|nr:hypothetical protein QBC35DRAFT_487992 [Podospora australis]